MNQLHLFEPTLEQLIEELICEPIEAFFETNHFTLPDEKNMRCCKVLTKKNVYDVSISESDQFDSSINYQASRKLFHKDFISNFFK